MPPTTSLLNLRQDFIKKLYKGRYPLASTTTSIGSTTALNDTILSPSSSDTDYFNAWIRINEAVTSGPAVGEIARVTNVDFSTDVSQLIFAPAFTATVQTGTDYELHYTFHPSYAEDRLNEVLENLEADYLIPLTLVNYGDMESDPATHFTTSGATVANSSTAGTVLHGRQSLAVSATATPGYAKSGTINITPGTTVFFSTDCYITPGDSATIILYDVTNSAAIGTAPVSNISGWVHLEGMETVPSTCERIQLWLGAVTNTDIIYFDNAIVLPVNDTVFTPPSLAEYYHDFGNLFYFPQGSSIQATGNTQASRIGEHGAEFWSHYNTERDDTASVPIRLEIARGPITHPLFIQTQVDFARLTSDSSTTTAPRNLVVNLALADTYDDMADNEEVVGEDTRALAYRANANRLRREIASDYKNFRPDKGIIRGAMHD